MQLDSFVVDFFPLKDPLTSQMTVSDLRNTYIKAHSLGCKVQWAFEKCAGSSVHHYSVMQDGFGQTEYCALA